MCVCVCAAIVQSHILALILQLFTRFPFNNILHHLVLTICSFVLEHGSDTVLTHLLNDCKMVEWLVSAPEEVEPKQAAGKYRYLFYPPTHPHAHPTPLHSTALHCTANSTQTT